MSDKKIVNFNIDVLWAVGFMIQTANERFIKFNERKEWFYYEDPDSIMYDEFDRVICDEQGHARHEMIKSYSTKNKLPEAVIFALNSLYIQDLMSNEFLGKILDEYAKEYSSEHEGDSISITGKRSQGVKFWRIARKLKAKKEKDLIWENICRGFGEHSLSVLDLTAQKEYPVEMGEHWGKMANIIRENYQEEFKKVHDQNDIELENEWIFSHFKFLGKGTGYQTFKKSDSDLYGNKAAGKRGISYGRWA